MHNPNDPVLQQLQATFAQIDASKPVDSAFLPRLPDGQHVVVINRFGGKNSAQNLGVILEADFVIDQTNAPDKVKPGDARGWPWFPQQKGWGGAYESDRYKNFTASIDQSIGNPDRPSSAVGNDLAMGVFRGVKLHVNVVPRNNKDGSRAMNKKGEPLSNAFFSPIQQTMQDAQARAASLPAPVRAAAAPAPTQQFAGAPHPSQMAGQYPAQAQYAPPMQPQPQYAPPAQPQYAPPMQTAPMPPQGYAQPQYGQPQYAPPQAPAAAPAPAGTPPGQMVGGILQGLR